MDIYLNNGSKLMLLYGHITALSVRFSLALSRRFRRAAAARTLLLPLHRDGLQFEMPATQQRPRPDEFPRGIISRRKVGRVNGIEFLE